MNARYDGWKTVWKVVRDSVIPGVLGAMLLGMGEALGAVSLEDGGGARAWLGIVGIALANGAVSGLRNWLKHSGPDALRRVAGIGLVLAVGLGLAGCATSARTEFIDADGTSFTAVSKAGPFGTLDTTNQKLVYEWDSEAGGISVGQDARGLDNSGQVEALRASVEVLPALVQGLIAGGILQPGGGSGGGGTGGASGPVGRLNDLLAELDEMRARLEALGLGLR